MKTEYEIRVLEIDIDRITNTLELLGAKKVGEYFQKRYVQQTCQPYLKEQFFHPLTDMNYRKPRLERDMHFQIMQVFCHFRQPKTNQMLYF